MSDIQYIDVDSEEFEDAPRALRAHVKKLQDRLTQVTTERDDYQSKWQARSATDALAGYGFRNPKRVSKDLLADGIDLSDEAAVKAWVEENGEDYAKGEAAPADAEQKADHSEEAQARAQIQDTASQMQPAGTDKLKAAIAEIPSDATPEQVAEVYKKFGI